MISALPYTAWQPGLLGAFSGIPNEVYHDSGKGKSVSERISKYGLSRSIAEKLILKSPAHCKEAMDNPKDPTKFMEFGTLVHCGTLEPEKLDGSYMVRPDTNPVDPEDKWHGNKKWCKNWLAIFKGTTILSVEEEKMLQGCVLALKSNLTLNGMLRTGQAELSVFAKKDDVLLKCRPDLIAEDAQRRTWVLDIKKCQDASFFAFQNESRRVHRDFQEAWYRYVLGLAGVHVDQFVFAAVEEEPPHGVGLYRIGPTNVEAMVPKVHEAIDRWFTAVESGEWPGYHHEVQEIGWKP